MADLLHTTLREVLIDDGRVALPGLGTFIRENHSAVLSGADRKILPPSARVVFNDNLVVNDGRLLRSLVERKGLLRPKAEGEMTSFIADIRHRLKAGEYVELTGIGQLFQQFDDRIVFTSETEGLAKASFGLPKVTFAPIVRSKAASGHSVDPLSGMPFAGNGAHSPPASPPPIVRPPRTVVREDLPKEIWYAVGIILLILALWALWGLFGTIGSSVVDDPRAPFAPRDRPARVEPVRPDPAPAAAPVPAETIRPEEPPRLNAERRTIPPAEATTPANRPTATRTPAPPPATNATAPETPAADGRNVALIAIGLYGNQANVRKNVLRIEQAGFEPFTERTGRYMRVGVKATYTTGVEKNSILERVRDRFTQDAFVMRVNGRKVE